MWPLGPTHHGATIDRSGLAQAASVLITVGACQSFKAGVDRAPSGGQTDSGESGHPSALEPGGGRPSDETSAGNGGRDEDNGGGRDAGGNGAGGNAPEPGEVYIDAWPTSPVPGPLSIAESISPWTDVIDVCFLLSSGKDTGLSQAQQDRIRKTVSDGWGRTALIRWRGFGPCLPSPARQSRVRVRIDGDLPPGVLGTADKLGAPGPPGAFTTVSFRDANPSERTILHVFGHVLGFLHPHADDTCSPTASAAETEPLRSVMSQSACYVAPTLAPADILAAQNAYSRHVAGSLVGMNAQCLDLTWPVTGACSPVEVCYCHGGDNQRWRMLADGTFLSPAAPTLLLDVFDGNSTDGTLVSVCGPNPTLTANQSWSFGSAEIRGIGDLCVDGGDPSGLRMQTCAAEPSQRWRVQWVSSEAVRVHAATNEQLCVRGSDEAGHPLVIDTCTADPQEIFQLSSLGELKYDQLCWSSEAGDARNGRSVMLEDCLPDGNAKRHQQYHLRGVLRSGLDKCLTTRTADFKDADSLYIYPCLERADFIWDYYFNPP